MDHWKVTDLLNKSSISEIHTELPPVIVKIDDDNEFRVIYALIHFHISYMPTTLVENFTFAIAYKLNNWYCR